MIDLEEPVNRVFNPDLRPLVSEAYRCYVSGSACGVIVLTWTAVCADLISPPQRGREPREGPGRRCGASAGQCGAEAMHRPLTRRSDELDELRVRHQHHAIGRGIEPEHRVSVVA